MMYSVYRSTSRVYIYIHTSIPVRKDGHAERQEMPETGDAGIAIFTHLSSDTAVRRMDQLSGRG